MQHDSLQHSVSAAEWGLMSVHCRLIQCKTVWRWSFCLFCVPLWWLVMLKYNTVTLFPQGSQCVPLRSLMIKQKDGLVAGIVETISAMHRSTKSHSVFLCVSGPYGSHYSCPVSGLRARRKLPAEHQCVNPTRLGLDQTLIINWRLEHIIGERVERSISTQHS